MGAAAPTDPKHLSGIVATSLFLLLTTPSVNGVRPSSAVIGLSAPLITPVT